MNKINEFVSNGNNMKFITFIEIFILFNHIFFKGMLYYLILILYSIVFLFLCINRFLYLKDNHLFMRKSGWLINMRNLNMKLSNMFAKFPEKKSKVMFDYGYIIKITILICLVLLFCNQYIFKKIATSEVLPTWIGSIATFLAVFVSLNINKNQPPMKIGIDTLISKKEGVIIQFLPRRKVDGFISCTRIDIVAVNGKIKTNVVQISSPILKNSKLSNNLLDTSWQMWRNITSNKVEKFYLYDPKLKNDSRLQRIIEYSVYYYTKLGQITDVKENKLIDCYISFQFTPNDYSTNINVDIPIRDLCDKDIINIPNTKKI